MKINGILMIDDEEMLRSLLADYLESEKFHVFLAESGLQGIEVIKQHRNSIHVILLDSNMPEMNGEQTLEEIRKIDSIIPIFLQPG